MAIRAVVFDFGGVLCSHPPNERFDPIAREFGIPTPELLHLFWAHRIPYDAGKLEPIDYWRTIAEAAGASLDESRLLVLFRQEIELWNDFDERVLSWAAHLRARGYGSASSCAPRPGFSTRSTT
jgi:putative hydrolase of the HAD superfamily